MTLLKALHPRDGVGRLYVSSRVGGKGLANIENSFDVRGACDKFLDVFVWTFKIVVDSWSFSMWLLYILRDDRPIIMISNSKEQLQQQLQYTLLKPDCHSWWISKMQSNILEELYVIRLCLNLEKKPTKTYGILQTAFGASCMNRASVSKWQKRFKEGRGFVRDDERCTRNREINTPELIGQRVRVRVTMLRFYGSSERDSLGRGQNSSNRVGGISTRTIHQSTSLSLSQTIWPRCAWRHFLSLPIVQTLLPVTFGYSPSSQAVIMRQLRKLKRLWQTSFRKSRRKTG